MKALFSIFIIVFASTFCLSNALLFADLEITCSTDTLLAVDEEACGKIFFHLQPEVISSIGEVTFTLVSGLPTGSIFPIGEMLQTWQAEDSIGNIVLCSYLVTVIDDIAPEILCPPDQVLPIMVDCISTLPNFLIDIEFSDNCNDDLNLTQTPEPGSLLQTSTIILIDVADQSGNSNTCAFYAMPEPMDNTISIEENTITSNFDGAIYQWVDCSGPKPVAINGEVAQSFTATQSGSYALWVTQGTCTVQSECVEMIISGLLEIEEEGLFDIFPNPTSGLVTIGLKEEVTGEIDIEVRNVLGHILMSKTAFSNRAYTMDLSHLPRGNYMITVTGSEGLHNRRIILR